MKYLTFPVANENTQLACSSTVYIMLATVLRNVHCILNVKSFTTSKEHDLLVSYLPSTPLMPFILIISSLMKSSHYLKFSSECSIYFKRYILLPNVFFFKFMFLFYRINDKRCLSFYPILSFSPSVVFSHIAFQRLLSVINLATMRSNTTWKAVQPSPCISSRTTE